jgi:stage V sporulation protein D (sporulation-specific penicillin-binding protein)
LPGKKKKKKKKVTEDAKRNRRLLFLIGLFLLIAAALVGRVFYIQFIWGQELAKEAYRQQNSGMVISPVRGNIYDRNGKELAVSVAVDNVTVSPKILRNNSKEAGEIARELAVILGFDTEAILLKLVKESEFEIIAKKVDRNIGDQVRAWISDNRIEGVYVDEDTERFYPNDTLASHVIGFTGGDNQGLFGIEATMEEFLKGIPGKIINEVDKDGNALPFSQTTEISADNGKSVVLTIDGNIQYIAEQALAKAIADNDVARGGCVIVADSSTGEILAMASNPYFNLNAPRENPPGFETVDWTGYTEEDTELLSKTVWKNKAVSDTYEPGSTFKAVVASMAIENNVIGMDDIVDDFPVVVQESEISCWSKWPHGEETFLEAIYNSCNPVFVKVSQELGIERFYEYVEMFGFYERTGISLPGEEIGLFHEVPMEIDMAVASFGQRFTITPVQLVSAYNAIANGGYLMNPMIVREILDDNGNVIEQFQPQVLRQVISEQTSRAIAEALEGVVAQGTGKNAFIPGYRVAGKTGTSETEEEDRRIASFCGFAPADNPVITVLVVLDDPQGESRFGGVIAAPVVGSIIEQTLEYMQVPRKGDEEYIERETIVPDVTGSTLEEAVRELKAANLEYIIEGDETGDDLTVVYQFPAAGELLVEKSVVVLYKHMPEDTVMVKMPDLRNKTLGEAKSTLHSIGLNIDADGAGVCVAQEFYWGTELEKGTVVEVRFRYLDNVD